MGATRDPSLPADEAADEAAAASGVGAGVEPLARALRAMATELERDPALARRVADAMQAPGLAAGRAWATDAQAPRRPASAPALASTVAAAALARTDGVDDTLAEQAAETTTVTPTRVNRTFHPRIVTGMPPELGVGVLNPFALAERLGEAGLRAALAELRLGSLRAIVREHRLDATGQLVGVNDAAKFRAVISEAVRVAGVATGNAAPTAPRQPMRKGRVAGAKAGRHDQTGQHD